MLAQLGVDYIGVAVGDPSKASDLVDLATARTIFEAVPGSVRVLLPLTTDVEQMVNLAQALQPDILHVNVPLTAVDAVALRELRRRLPDVRLMRGIPVTGVESIAVAKELQALVDYFLLDTPQHGTSGQMGATGQTHDWRVSAEIVRRVHIPVILAGGLSTENVAAAIHAVHPYGVDSLGRTSDPANPRRKHAALVKTFVEVARTTAATMP